jgi:hypothetical protein
MLRRVAILPIPPCSRARFLLTTKALCCLSMSDQDADLQLMHLQGYHFFLQRNALLLAGENVLHILSYLSQRGLEKLT